MIRFFTNETRLKHIIVYSIKEEKNYFCKWYLSIENYSNGNSFYNLYLYNNRIMPDHIFVTLEEDTKHKHEVVKALFLAKISNSGK